MKKVQVNADTSSSSKKEVAKVQAPTESKVVHVPQGFAARLTPATEGYRIKGLYTEDFLSAVIVVCVSQKRVSLCQFDVQTQHEKVIEEVKWVIGSESASQTKIIIYFREEGAFLKDQLSGVLRGRFKGIAMSFEKINREVTGIFAGYDTSSSATQSYMSAKLTLTEQPTSLIHHPQEREMLTVKKIEQVIGLRAKTRAHTPRNRKFYIFDGQAWEAVDKAETTVDTSHAMTQEEMKRFSQGDNFLTVMGKLIGVINTVSKSVPLRSSIPEIAKEITPYLEEYLNGYDTDLLLKRNLIELASDSFIGGGSANRHDQEFNNKLASLLPKLPEAFLEIQRVVADYEKVAPLSKPKKQFLSDYTGFMAHYEERRRYQDIHNGRLAAKAKILKNKAPAIALHNAGKYKEVVGLFQQILNESTYVFTKTSPELASAYYNLGRALFEAGDYRSAEFFLSTSLHFKEHYTSETKERLDKIRGYIKQCKENLEKIASVKKEAESQYAEATYRPIICIPEYLAGLHTLEEKIRTARRLAYKEQIKLVNELIHFIEKFYKGGTAANVFISPPLLDRTEIGYTARCQAVAIPMLQEMHPEIDFSKSDEVVRILFKAKDNKIIEMIETIRDDIFLEDLKKTLRMIFDVMHKFPRRQREEIVAQLPWSENSWYLFDFCGAVFCSDDAIDQGNREGGISIVPYGFNGDVTKQKLLAHYLRSLMGQTHIVKTACLDILAFDVNVMRDFFLQYYQRLDTGVGDFPIMGELPNLKAILWYSKQVYNFQRILTLLPAVPGNNPDQINPDVLEDSGIKPQLNTSKRIYMADFLKDKKFKADAPESAKAIFHQMAEREKAAGITWSVQDLMDMGFIEGDNITYGSKTRQNSVSTYDLVVGKSDKPIPIGQRLMLTSATDYHKLDTLKGRLALLRKLQLVGETLSSKNLGNNFIKHMEFINDDMLRSIRNALVHIEKNNYREVVKELEDDAAKLGNILEEFQLLKEAIYEEVSKRQEKFPFWPKPNTLSWQEFARQYWEKVKQVYLPPPPVQPVVVKAQLISADKIDKVLALVKDENKQKVRGILEAEMTEFKADSIALYISNAAGKVTKLLSSVEKEFRKNKSLEKAKEAKLQPIIPTKSELKGERDAAMKSFPTIKEYAIKFTGVGGGSKMPHPDVDELVLLLQNRFSLLQQLIIKESSISVSGKSQVQQILEKNLLQDMAFLMSTSYLLGQIINVLNVLSKKVDLSKVNPSLLASLPKYIALRNHLEHTDPILESIELPYYEMMSEAPQMMAVVLSELLVNFEKVIMDMDAKNLVPLLVGDAEKVNQEAALDPSDFTFTEATKAAAKKPVSTGWRRIPLTEQQEGWNCFDVAVGLERQALVAFALDNNSRVSLRLPELLAPEIRHAAALTVAYMIGEKADAEVAEKAAAQRILELVEISQALEGESDEDQLKVAKELSLVVNEKGDKSGSSTYERYLLPPSMRTPALCDLVRGYFDAHESMRDAVSRCNTALGIVGKILSLAELDARFQDLAYRAKNLSAFNEYTQTRDALFTLHELQFMEYSVAREVYNSYVAEHYGKNQWFAFQRGSRSFRETSMVDIAACMLQAQISIHDFRDLDTPLYKTKMYGLKAIHVEFNGVHFTRLQAGGLPRQSSNNSLNTLPLFNRSEPSSSLLAQSQATAVPKPKRRNSESEILMLRP